MFKADARLLQDGIEWLDGGTVLRLEGAGSWKLGLQVGACQRLQAELDDSFQATE